MISVHLILVCNQLKVQNLPQTWSHTYFFIHLSSGSLDDYFYLNTKAPKNLALTIIYLVVAARSYYQMKSCTFTLTLSALQNADKLFNPNIINIVILASNTNWLTPIAVWVHFIFVYTHQIKYFISTSFHV